MYAILGCGSVGANIAKILTEKQNKVIIIENDKGRVEGLREQGFDTVLGDIREFDLKLIENADAILILTSNIDANYDAVKRIREINKDIYIVVRASDLASVKKMKELKVESTIQQGDVIARSVIRELEEYESRKKIYSLLNILNKGEGVSIFVHNNPDPDALASAIALKRICQEKNIDAKIYYGGEIGHQENSVFLNVLGIEVNNISKDEVWDKVKNRVVALLDFSKPSGNNILPTEIPVNVVIDHHLVERETINADYQDIRGNIGATSTILVEYLRQLEIIPEANLATALLYGIRVDTKNFTRNTSPDDLNAAAFLSPLVDNELLQKIEKPPVSIETLDIIGRAIANREIRGAYLLSCVDVIKNRDVLPQAAEFLLALENVSTVLVYGIVNGNIIISARTEDIRLNLTEVMKKAFGNVRGGYEEGSAGGHKASAGAQIPLGIFGDIEDKEMLINLAKNVVRKQFFAVIGIEIEKK